jgi:hypothetical protein
MTWENEMKVGGTNQTMEVLDERFSEIESYHT